jgi:DegV family protein with EDD domain
MPGVRIVTDSACDLTEEQAASAAVRVVPLSIRFGEEEFVDREELSIDEFYSKMATSDTLPETAAPSPGAFEKTFRELAEEGADAIVCINLSFGLSATGQSAQNAAQAVAADLDVRVIDSRTITGGLGTLVLTAARDAAAGADADTVQANVADLSSRTKVFGALNTLDNLKKGGRIGGAKALVGSLLAVKPVLDLSSGVVVEAGKPRTRRKSFAWLCDQITSEGAVENLAALHGNADDFDDFLAMLGGVVDASEIRVGKIGAVIGAHGGPGVLGLSYNLPN